MLVHQEQQSQQVLRWIGVGRGDGGTRSGGLSDYYECPSAYAPEYCSLRGYPECSSAGPFGWCSLRSYHERRSAAAHVYVSPPD